DHVADIVDFAESSDRVVAIGEIGLDYHYEGASRREQQDWFIEQIEVAKELDLPIIVHSRDAAQDTMDIIREYDAAMVGGIIHCFSGSVEMAREYVAMGFHLGVGGMITFNNSKKAREVVTQIPLEHLLLETDAPYMTPVPNRGKRNDSGQIPYVARTIAELKQISVEEVFRVTTRSAKQLFHIE
ncbi:MAG: TatD family hydrolase, partial [Lachnospiraceae bacterium]|nr:TatD family hydrolase [Lachnospiraceae bacterium]